MKSNLRISLIVVLCLLLTMTTTPALVHPTSSSLEEKVDAYIKETMDRLPIPGLAIGIVKGDRVLYLQGYGTANVEGDPVTPRPFPLASVTKTFTALAASTRPSREADLDAPVQTYLPEFRVDDEHTGATVTVRHLLDHTSGISTIEGTEPYLQSPNATFDEALKQLTHYSPAYVPGEHYEYSNWNYVLLGEVISRQWSAYVEYMRRIYSTRWKCLMPVCRLSYPARSRDWDRSSSASRPYDERRFQPPGAGYANASAEEMTHYLLTFFNHGQYNGMICCPAKDWAGMTSWNWHTGMPEDICYGFSGGHNSINTNIQLFSLHKVGVVVLMNTRLEQLIPGPTANDIAFNLAP
jgi:CubicO group peptidase (beta-lactamase class C family)